jgi:class 3 adenylate cyclase
MIKMYSHVRRTGLPCTVLCVDVCGSTKLYDALGNTRALAVIGKALALLSQAASRNRGTIVKTIGDELMCTFSRLRDAAVAAEDMQRSLRQSILKGDIEIKTFAVRVGFHSGRVMSHSADSFGGAALKAKRLTVEAKPGQILMAKKTLSLLPNAIAVRTRYVGSTDIDGKREPLFEFIWDDDSHDLTLAQDTFDEQKRGSTRAKVRFREATHEVGVDRPVIRMGRGPENDIDVPDSLASRVHAKIEWRRDRLFLVDQSLNGTYLQIQGKPEIMLRRDEVVLERTGIISLGKSTAVEGDACVRFELLKDGKVVSRSVMWRRSVR